MSKSPKRETPDIEWTEEKTWQEFRDAGLLWWVNRVLHLFGWAIALRVENLGCEQKIVAAYPVRCKYRGFSIDVEEQGFIQLSEYLAKEAGQLLEETKL